MRVVNEEGKERWSWEKELTAHFGNLSPGMRGSFKNPVPGSPVSIPPADKSLALGQKVEDLHDEVARKNFRLIIIKVSRVLSFDRNERSFGLVSLTRRSYNPLSMLTNNHSLGCVLLLA